MVAAAAQVEPVLETPVIRRFDLPDFDRHPWLIRRMVSQFKHMNDRAAMSHLRSILYNNEHLFLYSEHAVALAQVMSANAFAADPIILERFVWCERKDDPAQQAEASHFYSEFAEWGKRQRAEAIIVEECSDVPHELVRERLGKRVFERVQKFAKVGDPPRMLD